jgi:cytochrome P450
LIQIRTLLHLFVLCMLLNPEVQYHAQQEIDRVIGADRLPTFSDRESLPYVNAILTECLRWHLTVPFGAVKILNPLFAGG